MHHSQGWRVLSRPPGDDRDLSRAGAAEGVHGLAVDAHADGHQQVFAPSDLVPVDGAAVVQRVAADVGADIDGGVHAGVGDQAAGGGLGEQGGQGTAPHGEVSQQPVHGSGHPAADRAERHRFEERAGVQAVLQPIPDAGGLAHEIQPSGVGDAGHGGARLGGAKHHGQPQAGDSGLGECGEPRAGAAGGRREDLGDRPQAEEVRRRQVELRFGRLDLGRHVAAEGGEPFAGRQGVAQVPATGVRQRGERPGERVDVGAGVLGGDLRGVSPGVLRHLLDDLGHPVEGERHLLHPGHVAGGQPARDDHPLQERRDLGVPGGRRVVAYEPIGRCTRHAPDRRVLSCGSLARVEGEARVVAGLGLRPALCHADGAHRVAPQRKRELGDAVQQLVSCLAETDGPGRPLEEAPAELVVPQGEPWRLSAVMSPTRPSDSIRPASVIV